MTAKVLPLPILVRANATDEQLMAAAVRAHAQLQRFGVHKFRFEDPADEKRFLRIIESRKLAKTKGHRQ